MKKNIIISVVFWSIYFLIVTAFSSTYIGIDRALRFSTILIFFQAALVYMNLCLLVPFFLEKKRIGLYVAGSVFTIIIILFIRFHLPAINDDQNAQRFNGIRLRIVFFTFNLIFAFVISTVYYFIIEWYRNNQLKSEMKYQKAETELKYLNSRINPHFLFNTLNNIYTLCYLKDDNAAPAVMKLSEMMRYILHDGSATLIELEKEVQFIKSFIALQSLKKEQLMQVSFNVQGVKRIHRIAPLILIIFFENCYKHGDIERSPSGWIRAELNVDEQSTMSFTIANTISGHNETREIESGIGLENVKKRLSMMYQENYTLDIKTEQNIYSIHFSLNLDNLKMDIVQ